MTFSEVYFFFLPPSLPKLIWFFALSYCFYVYFWAATSPSASAWIRLIFSEYSCSCAVFFLAGRGFSSTGAGGGATSSYSSFFLAWRSGTEGCCGGSLGFLMRAAEGGLFGLSYFFSSFFSGSGSAFPRALFTKASEDLPLAAHLAISCSNSLVA